MKKREWISLIILAMAVMPAILIGIGQIYVTGIDGERLNRPETGRLLMEMAALFVVTAAGLRAAGTNRARLGILVCLAALFTWIHQVFLPMVLSGVYLAVLLRCGGSVRRLFDRERRLPEYHAVTGMADLTLGCGCMILLFCLMSLAGIGSIPWTRAGAAGFLAFSFLPAVSGREERKKARKKIVRFWDRKKALSVGMTVFAAFIFTMTLLQAGRMNICADYDSLHYGLRSEYILNNGGGIYENMGSINVVYTYSKGLEILLFPISGLPSYSFFLSFQIWMTLGILFVSGEIVKLFVSHKYGVLCMAVLSSIPGIMNMGITAKTDSATALFQLIMIYFLLLFIKKQRSGDLALAGNAFFMTMVLKPTALVFSTALAGTAFVCMFAMKRFRVSVRERLFLSWIPMVMMWGLVWLRTWLHTGLPVTSVFYSIWAALGFRVRYPYRFESLPSNGGSLFSVSGLKHFAKRLYGVLLAPVGEDMAHVRIAWGSPYLLVFLVLFLVPLFARMSGVKKRDQKPLICLVCLFLVDGAASLAALYLLWQVDGNYFILLYALFGILAAILIGKVESPLLTHLIIKLLIPVALFNVSVTAVSNWKGTLGLSPVKLNHKGYYDHWAAEKEKMEEWGNGEIWEILSEDPRTRVIVFGDQPDMLMFPCNTQSYTDIEGSGGNFFISASPEALVSFFSFARTDYVYLGSGYLRPGSEGWRNVTAMIERGYLTDIFYENGNGLARFVTEPVNDETAQAELRRFAERYWPGEQQ